jgi:chemotaxis protein CheZ
MAQSRPKKRFVAEILRDQGTADTAPSAPDGSETLARHDETMTAIAELRSFMAQCLSRSEEPPNPGQSEPEVAIDAGKIRHELETLRDAIISTKREIAAVRHPAAPSDRLMLAADELDAVVEATEQATNTILQAAETVDDMAERIKQASQDAYIARTSDEMRELILKIFEACNFQDITGQRITKVVNTVKFIEERVNAMIAIWGMESFAEIEVPAPAAAHADKALLSGPQRAENAVSQDDIDKLFE